MEKRRQFIKNLALGSAGLALGQTVLARNSVVQSAKSYKNIIGANDRIRLAVIGVNGRGTSMAATIARQPNAEVACICDVDERVLPKAVKSVMDAKQANSNNPRTEKDCRKVVQDKSIDAIYIATPDHWHTPLTVMGCQGGKHVYVEKP